MLLYRSNNDGLDLEKIKSKLKNKSNLIFLFLTGNSRIFGAFIKTKIEEDEGSYTKDENAFVFSLNNNKIYKILKPELAIKFHEKWKILIGNTLKGNGFYFIGNSIYDEGLLNEPRVYDFQKNYELTEGKDKLNELEIFNINFD